jgi:hypothetical protein
LWKVTISFMSVRLSARNNSAPSEWILIKRDSWDFFFRKSVELKFNQNPKRITDTSHEEVFTFMTIFRWPLLRIRNISDKVVEKIRIHVLCSITFSRNSAVYEIISRNMVESERPLMTIWRRLTCWIRKATRAQSHAIAFSSILTHTHTHTLARTHKHTQKYVRLTAFPRQQWFRERISVFRYIYISCFVKMGKRRRVVLNVREM